MQVDPHAGPAVRAGWFRLTGYVIGPGDPRQVEAGASQQAVVDHRAAVDLNESEGAITRVVLELRRRHSAKADSSQQLDRRFAQDGLIRHHFGDAGDTEKRWTLAEFSHGQPPTGLAALIDIKTVAVDLVVAARNEIEDSAGDIRFLHPRDAATEFLSVSRDEELASELRSELMTDDRLDQEWETQLFHCCVGCYSIAIAMWQIHADGLGRFTHPLFVQETVRRFP